MPKMLIGLEHIVTGIKCLVIASSIEDKISLIKVVEVYVGERYSQTCVQRPQLASKYNGRC